MPNTPLHQRPFERILLIKLSALGDVIHTIALLNALRQRYPNARIDWILKPSVAEVIRHHPAVSNVLVYGENQTEAPQYNWDGIKLFGRLLADRTFLAGLRRLRATRYDLVIDVHGQFRTGFLTMMSGAPVRLGFDRPRQEFWERSGAHLPAGTMKRAWKGSRERSWYAYTHTIPLKTLDIHAADRYLVALEALGHTPGPPDFSFVVPEAAHAHIARLLAEAGVPAGASPVVISPAALWETKRWRLDGFAEVARHLIASGRSVVLTGSAAEREDCHQIVKAAPGVIDLSGKTSLLELAALLKRSALCVTNDSGPMHMAVALGRPVVAIFGSTNPVWVGPYGQAENVVSLGLPCQPCNIRNLDRCPHDHACMSGLQASAVIARVDAALTRIASQQT